MTDGPDPTSAISVDFGAYVASREQKSAGHLVDGLPNYGFLLDLQLRRRLASIGPLRWAVRTATRLVEPVQRYLLDQDGMSVGPHQHPRLYDMSNQCAKRLGIEVPRLYIVPDQSPNLWTLATDAGSPSIAMSSHILDLMEEDELLALMGHECGHIHSMHGAWQSLVVMSSNPLARSLLSNAASAGLSAGPLSSIKWLVGGVLVLFLAEWSRCAEVTCDRAGAICAGNAGAMCRALIKLQFGRGTKFGNVNIDEYLKQIPSTKSSILRLLEMARLHPATHKRIEALRLFSESNIASGWKLVDTPAQGRPRKLSDIDVECAQLISVWDSDYGSKGPNYGEGME